MEVMQAIQEKTDMAVEAADKEKQRKATIAQNIEVSARCALVHTAIQETLSLQLARGDDESQPA